MTHLRNHTLAPKRNTFLRYLGREGRIWLLWLAAAIWLWQPVIAQAQPVGIPAIGSASSAELSPQVEAMLGDAIMEEGRRDPTYIDEIYIRQYLTDMGQRLAEAAPVNINQTIRVFAVRDPSINAFALPGGYIGINSGLIATSRTEAELASVLAHEIAHVGQRHVARGMTQSAQTSHAMMAALAGALLAALSGSADLAMGVATFGQAAAIDRQLGFSRQAEQEADRIGFQMLSRAGYDPQGMAKMFQRLMQSSRLNEPPRGSYASTHPLSRQRQSDAENRIANAPRQDTYYSNDDFWFVRAATRVVQARGGMPLQELLQQFDAESQGDRSVEQAAALYGKAFVAFKRKEYADSLQLIEQARTKAENAALDILEIEVLMAQNKSQQALQLAQKAWQRWSDQQALAVVYTEALQAQGQDDEVIRFLQARIDEWPDEPRWYQRIAKSYERVGQPIAARKAMAEYYERVGALPVAIEQLRQARNMSDDFYEQSRLDVEIRDLQDRMEREREMLSRYKN
ncbi:MAG TPA: M48 family metalloprotease [Paenalcaligenes sp.]|nr:M48 family metalloprotease [Paenalcaligenes sp.]